MSVRRVVTLLLVVFASVVCGAVVLRQELTAPPAAALVHRKLVRGAISVSISNDTGHFTLYRHGESGDCSETFACAEAWFLEGFEGIPLSAERVQLTLEALATARVIQTVRGNEDFEVYGLNPPLLQVSLKGRDTRMRTIAIGKRSDYLGGRYALSVDGATVLLVEDSLLPLVNIKQHEYFALTPQYFKPESISHFVVQNETERFKVYRVQDLWKVSFSEEEPPLEASRNNVELFLHALSRLAATRLVPLVSEEGKTIASQMPIKLSLFHDESELPQLISFATTNEVRMPGVKLPENQIVFLPDTSKAVYFAHPGDASPLFQGSAGFRRRRILEFDLRDFSKAILYNRDEGVFEISRSETEWEVNGKPGDGPFVKELFRELSEIECSGFVPKDVSGGIDEVSAQIWVRGRSEPLEATFVSFGESSGGYFVRGEENIKGCFVDARRLRKIVPRGEILYRGGSK